MFEQFTEKARRAIFFARYEASAFGSHSTNPEHLLLALLREDTLLKLELPGGAWEAVRRELEASFPRPVEHVSTSVDLPLSRDARLALSYAAEEQKALEHEHIESGHLILGLLRLENGTPAKLLRQHGIDLATWREHVKRSLSAVDHEQEIPAGRFRAVDRPNPFDEPEPAKTVPLGMAIARLSTPLETMASELAHQPDTYADAGLRRNPWSRQEALGNLVDWGITYQHWLARALTEPKLIVAGYPEDDWVTAQKYGSFSWPDLVDLWICVNRLLVHVLGQVQEDKMSLECRVGIERPITLLKLVDRYLEHCEDVAGQIMAHL